MTRSTPARPFARIIAGDPTLADWDRRRRAESDATGLVRAALPRPIAGLVDAQIPAPGQVALRVSSGAVAAAVRQRLPAISAALTRGGVQCREVRVRVQPGGDRQPEQKPVYRQIDMAGIPALAEVEATLAPGPLKSAVRRLLRRAGR